MKEFFGDAGGGALSCVAESAATADQTKHPVANAEARSTGIRADLVAPARVVPTLSYLQRYAAIVIVDTAASELGGPLLDRLIPYVRDLGHGLVVIGGLVSATLLTLLVLPVLYTVLLPERATLAVASGSRRRATAGGTTSAAS